MRAAAVCMAVLAIGCAQAAALTPEQEFGQAVAREEAERAKPPPKPAPKRAAAPAPKLPKSFRPLADDERAIIAATVAHDFKDPDSARFRWPPVAADDKPMTVQEYCGMVNAKNSYGAYVGFTPFMVALVVKGHVVSAILMKVGSDKASTSAISEVCHKNGLPIDAP